MIIKELLDLYKSSTPEDVKYLHGSVEQFDERVQEFKKNEFPFIATILYPTLTRVRSAGRANFNVRQLVMFADLVDPYEFDKIMEDRILNGDFKDIEQIAENFERGIKANEKVSGINSWSQTYSDNLLKKPESLNQNLNFILVDFTFEYYARPC